MEIREVQGLHVLKLSVRVKATAKMARCPSGTKLLAKASSGGEAPEKNETLAKQGRRKQAPALKTGRGAEL